MKVNKKWWKMLLDRRIARGWYRRNRRAENDGRRYKDMSRRISWSKTVRDEESQMAEKVKRLSQDGFLGLNMRSIRWRVVGGVASVVNCLTANRKVLGSTPRLKLYQNIRLWRFVIFFLSYQNPRHNVCVIEKTYFFYYSIFPIEESERTWMFSQCLFVLYVPSSFRPSTIFLPSLLPVIIINLSKGRYTYTQNDEPLFIPQ